MKYAALAFFASASAAMAHEGHPVVAPGAEGHAVTHSLIGLALVVVAAGVYLLRRHRAEG
ncbi:hypothetical protein [Thalassovita sp.]|jgi:hypothetical protein|uniref:hypothetical protein n=1 Tax=Thalassovita sp. TaxID=1979401 RepID=UPI003B59A434